MFGLYMKDIVNNPNSLVSQFFDFLKKFGVIGLAIGLVLGGAVKDYVDKIINAIVTPIINTVLNIIKFQAGGKIALPEVSGKVEYLMIGDFIGATINFVVLAFVVFLTVKFFMNKFMTDDDHTKTGL